MAIKHITIKRLYQLIKEETIKLLTEEMGIAKEVTIVAQRIYTEIEEATKVAYQQNRSITIKTTAFGYDITIAINNTNFNSQEEFDSAYRAYKDGIFSGWCYFKKPPFSDKPYISITLDTVTINGVMVKEGVINTLQHELSHIYEQVQRQKPYTISKSYLIGKSHLGDKDKLPISIALVLYFSGDGEHTAYGNGLYAETLSQLEMGKPHNQSELLDSSNYNIIQHLQECLYTLSNANRTTVNDILKDWDLDLKYSDILKIARRTLKKYITSARKSWYKAHQDYAVGE